MKNIYVPLLLALLTITSCKKENISNNTGTPGDTRTGLERLVSPTAQNFCVLVISDNQGLKDTVVWQSTTDTSFSSRGAGGSSGNYYYSAGATFQPKVVEKFKNFGISFRKKITTLQVYPCSYIDSAIRMGTVPVSNDYIALWLTDDFGLGMVNLLTNNASAEVLSKTATTIAYGNCTKVRTKVQLTNIQFGPFGCIAPPYNINDGIVQMDY